MRELTNRDFGMRSSDFGFELGIIVDAGPTLGYGHVVRCVRLAQALEPQVKVVFYPLSEDWSLSPTCVKLTRSRVPFSARECVTSAFVTWDLRKARPTWRSTAPSREYFRTCRLRIGLFALVLST